MLDIIKVDFIILDLISTKCYFSLGLLSYFNISKKHIINEKKKETHFWAIIILQNLKHWDTLKQIYSTNTIIILNITIIDIIIII